MRHVVIGTAGHVDHGKTALVYALTGVETDRLPEEQRRGITIELGFAPWRLADDLCASVVDVPGHRRLVHTMIAGAYGVDLVLLVVAADEGVMPQTREHVAACELLGVRRAVVAVTKIDRADEELCALAGEEALELLAAHGLDAELVRCSARTGEGVPAVGEAVRRAVTGIRARDASAPARLGVDRVFTVHGTGTVVTGTLVAGRLGVGDGLRVLGPERELASSVRGLHVHGEPCQEAAAPTRLAINLGGVALAQIERGDVVTTCPDVRATRLCDVWLHDLGRRGAPSTQRPIRRGAQASLFVGTARATARILPAHEPELASGLARLRLSRPLVAFGADRFVLRGADRDGPAGAVLGGGVVLDAHPPPRSRVGKRQSLLTALWRGEPREVARGLAAELSPRPIERAALGARLSVPRAQLDSAAAELARAGELVALPNVGWVSRAGLEEIERRAGALVAEHHRAEPLEPGLPRQTLRERLAAAAGALVAELAIARLTAARPGGGAPPLCVAGSAVRLASFAGAAQDAAAAGALRAATDLLGQAALQGASEHAVQQAAGLDAKRVRTLLALMVRDGGAVHAGDLWFAAEAVRVLERQVTQHLQAQGRLTIQQLKAMTGLGRKQTIPLLEHLDRAGVTRRVGDDRVPGR